LNYENDIRVRTKKFAVRIVKLTQELKNSNVDYPLRDKNELLEISKVLGAIIIKLKA